MKLEFNKRLFQCLEEEKSIFRVFSSSLKFDRFECFHSPNVADVPHWNMVYPGAQKLEYNEDALQIIKDYYAKIGLVGHVCIEIGDSEKRSFPEISEYFYGSSSNERTYKEEVSTLEHSEEELDLFCNMVSDVFEYSKEARVLFRDKMTSLSQREGSKFYVVFVDGKAAGACSTFLTDGGAHFLFNVVVYPEFRGNNFTSIMLDYICGVSNGIVYTYSHNSAMRETILPKAGFIPIGTIGCLPIGEIK